MTSEAVADDLQQRATAYHEAGHAVIGARHGNFIRHRGITIGNGAGHCHIRRLVGVGFYKVFGSNPMLLNALQRDVVRDVEADLAGWTAEFLHHGWGRLHNADDFEFWCGELAYRSTKSALCDLFEDGDINDGYLATATLIEERRALNKREELAVGDIDAIVARGLELQAQVHRRLQEPPIWKAVEDLARMLIKTGYVDTDTANEIIDARLGGAITRSDYCGENSEPRPRAREQTRP